MRETRRFSGLRVHLMPQNLRAVAQKDLDNALIGLVPVAEAIMQEPLMVDDAYRHLPPLQLMKDGLVQGELFTLVTDRGFAAIMLLRNILINRHAELEAWVHPEFRSNFSGKLFRQFAREVFEYAFRPFSNGNINTDGLGLLKIKAAVAVENESAARAVAHLGFQPVGLFRLDGLFNSHLHDIVMLELFNPEFAMNSPVEVMSSAPSSQPTAAASIRPADSVSSTESGIGDGAISARGSRRDEARSKGRSAASRIPATKKPKHKRSGTNKKG